MKVPTSTYITFLFHLQNDLKEVIKNWESTSEPKLDVVDNHVTIITALSLVAGQIQELQNAPIRLHDANPMRLYNEIEKLLSLMICDDEKSRFTEHLAMLDTFISNEVFHGV